MKLFLFRWATDSHSPTPTYVVNERKVFIEFRWLALPRLDKWASENRGNRQRWTSTHFFSLSFNGIVMLSMSIKQNFMSNGSTRTRRSSVVTAQVADRGQVFAGITGCSNAWLADDQAEKRRTRNAVRHQMAAECSRSEWKIERPKNHRADTGLKRVRVDFAKMLGWSIAHSHLRGYITPRQMPLVHDVEVRSVLDTRASRTERTSKSKVTRVIFRIAISGKTTRSAHANGRREKRDWRDVESWVTSAVRARCLGWSWSGNSASATQKSEPPPVAQKRNVADRGGGVPRSSPPTGFSASSSPPGELKVLICALIIVITYYYFDNF